MIELKRKFSWFQQHLCSSKAGHFLGEHNVIEIVTRLFTKETGVKWRIYFECLFEWLLLADLSFEKIELRILGI